MMSTANTLRQNSVNTGILFDLTNIVFHFALLLQRACGSTAFAFVVQLYHTAVKNKINYNFTFRLTGSFKKI